MASFIFFSFQERTPGMCIPHQIFFSTFTFSQGGLPSRQSKPGRSRRNTSGKAAGKCSGVSDSTAAATPGWAAWRMKADSSKSSGRVQAPARWAVIKSNSARAPATARWASWWAVRASSISRLVASEVRASRRSALSAAASSSSSCERYRLGASGSASGSKAAAASSRLPTPVRLSPHTRLWSKKLSGRPGTKVWTHTARRASSTATWLRSTP